MKAVILDTSSVLFGISNRIDVVQKLSERFPDYEILIPSGVVRELTKLSADKRKESRQAKVALAMIKSHSITVVRASGYVDDWILGHSGDKSMIVCTNDTELKRRLKLKGVMVVSIARSGSLR